MFGRERGCRFEKRVLGDEGEMLKDFGIFEKFCRKIVENLL